MHWNVYPNISYHGQEHLSDACASLPFKDNCIDNKRHFEAVYRPLPDITTDSQILSDHLLIARAGDPIPI